MRCFSFIVLLLATCLSSFGQLVPVTISNRLNSELDINVKIEEMQSSKLTAICFLDSMDVGFVNVMMELKAKAIESQSQVTFLIVKFSSRILDSESIHFYGNKILESQFYIKSNVFQITEEANHIFEIQQGKLPSRIKKVDLSKCLRDKKLSTYVVSFLFPAIDESMKLFERYSKDIAIRLELEAVTAFSMDIQSDQKKNRQQIDSLQKIVRELERSQTEVNVQIRTLSNEKSTISIGPNIERLFSGKGLQSNISFGLKSIVQVGNGANVYFVGSLKNSSLNKSVFLSDTVYLSDVSSTKIARYVSRKDFTEEINLRYSLCQLGARVDVLKLSNSKISKTNLLIGCDLGFRLNSKMSYKNSSGLFSYFGVSSNFIEEIHNIPELGLLDNVEYIGVSGIYRLPNSFLYCLGFDLVRQLDNKGNFKIVFAGNYMADFKRSKSSLDIVNKFNSSYYGDYQSVYAVNNSNIYFPSSYVITLGIQISLK